MAAIQLNPGGMNSNTIPGSGPSYFLGAPWSKAITAFVIGMYILSESLTLHSTLALDYDRVLNEGEVWRLVTCQFTFETIGAMLFGMAVLCQLLRRFEREMGSRKFGTFCFLSTVLSISWEVLLLQILHLDSIYYARSSGPYSQLGSLLLLYHLYTPRLHPRFFGFLGFDFSEKAFSYGLAFQLVYSGESLSTIIPFFCGALAGFFCITPALPLHKVELPHFVHNFFSMISGPFVEVPPTTQRRRTPNVVNNPMNVNGAVRRQRHATDSATTENRQRRAPTVPDFPAPPPPSDEMVESLTSMGFEREASVRMLQQCNNNVELAVNRLLSS